MLFCARRPVDPAWRAEQEREREKASVSGAGLNGSTSATTPLPVQVWNRLLCSRPEALLWFGHVKAIAARSPAERV